ncbi:hypothetical protein RHGRI_000387 [Rhododendron griersonianum]|uniref:Uncharacterized protein n=1 Tax=Rhododendron griersonianum TaxID=479676 RepID=A0AAV6LJM7_9ERIC|nr:hypothetical protein RHGRI_000387 [Rhododendron griersonianum]
MVVEWLLNVLSRPLIMEATIEDQLFWKMGNVSGFKYTEKMIICEEVYCIMYVEIVCDWFNFFRLKIQHTTVDDQLSSAELPSCPSSLASAMASVFVWRVFVKHDDKSLGRRNGRMRFSDFHGILHELYN